MALCSASSLPSLRHHVYYGASHVLSIAAHTSGSGPAELYAADVAHNRITHYSADGRMQDVWPVSDLLLYSPTSMSYIDQTNPASTVLYVCDSSQGQLPRVDVTTGQADDTMSYQLLQQIWECGLVQGEDGDHARLYPGPPPRLHCHVQLGRP